MFTTIYTLVAIVTVVMLLNFVLRNFPGWTVGKYFSIKRITFGIQFELLWDFEREIAVALKIGKDRGALGLSLWTPRISFEWFVAPKDE